MSTALPAFSAYGIELEYMIVDRDSLAVRPIADALLRDADGMPVSCVERGGCAWSNELTRHVIEVKNDPPSPHLESLPALFQAEVTEINRRLASLGAQLMPGGTHPWMTPETDTQLWPHDQAEIYQAYDRIFNCRQHGFANLQSMHINLPFASNEEFCRLHAAVRLVLPILPALAASSPFMAGQASGFMDGRMEAYRTHQARLPASLAEVIPDTMTCREQYEREVLAPMYDALAVHDPAGTLRHEWLNARGAVPRFDRSAIEIRVIDMQECPRADLAIAAVTVAVIQALYHEEWSPLAAQQAIATESLVTILKRCIRDADRAVIDQPEYLHLLDYPGKRATAAALWAHLIDTTHRIIPMTWREPLNILREEGPLARRIQRAVGPEPDRSRLEAVSHSLCHCLAEGRLFWWLD